MTQQVQTIAKPAAPSDEVLQDGRYTLLAEHPTAGQMLVVYDPSRLVGGLYHVEQQLWRLQVPVTLQEFIGGLQANQIRLPEGADLQTWLDAVSGLTSGRAN